jgi:ceramide glucosyltransferase
MPGSGRKIVALATGVAALAGVAYTALAIARVRRFARNAGTGTSNCTTPISVLKPLCGNEPNLFENLLSFCDQVYPQYQIIFGAADPADPALQVARAVAARFPERDIEIVAGRAHPSGNPKVGNLLGMIDLARHPLIIIADSDIRVGRDYLQAVAGCFEDASTGAATCIYGGVPGTSLASRLGAMQVNDHFAPSVMVATALEPLTYCFGATMAVKRDVLARIGGLHAIAEHLADDYLLGKLVAETGHVVALVPYAVQTTIADDTLRALWRRELRWARAISGQRPAGYAGSVVTYVLPFAAASALASRTPFSATIFAVSAMLRVVLHYDGRRAFAPQSPASVWLIPLRDLFGLAVWAASFCGKRVLWKTGDYRLDAGGRMAPGTKEM